MAVKITIDLVEGWVLNPDPVELNNKIREIGEHGGCSAMAQSLVVCPCPQYLHGRGCALGLYVPEHLPNSSLQDPKIEK